MTENYKVRLDPLKVAELQRRARRESVQVNDDVRWRDLLREAVDNYLTEPTKEKRT